MEPGSTSGHGHALQLAALYRPGPRGALGIIGRFRELTRCLDSVGLLVASVYRGGYLVLLWPLRPVKHELFASGGDRALGADVTPEYRCRTRLGHAMRTSGYSVTAKV